LVQRTGPVRYPVIPVPTRREGLVGDLLNLSKSG